MNVVLYSTGCPKCHVLQAKLASTGVDYVENNDVDEMVKKGMMSLPYLEVDGKLMDFMTAVQWVNNQDQTQDFQCESCKL